MGGGRVGSTNPGQLPGKSPSFATALQVQRDKLYVVGVNAAFKVTADTHVSPAWVFQPDFDGGLGFSLLGQMEDPCLWHIASVMPSIHKGDWSLHNQPQGMLPQCGKHQQRPPKMSCSHCRALPNPATQLAGQDTRMHTLAHRPRLASPLPHQRTEN